MTSINNADKEIDNLEIYEIRTPLDKLINYIGHYICWLSFFAMGITIIEIIARYVFNNPTIWVNETTVFFIAVTFIYSGSFVLARNRHIRINVVYNLLSERNKKYLDIFNDFLSLVFVIGLSFAAYQMMSYSIFRPDGSFVLEGTASIWNPPTPSFIKIFLFITMITLVLQTFFHLIQSIAKLKPKSEGKQ